MPADRMTRLSDEAHATLQRLVKRTGRPQGELIEDALALLAGKMARTEHAQRLGLPDGD